MRSRVCHLGEKKNVCPAGNRKSFLPCSQYVYGVKFRNIRMSSSRSSAYVVGIYSCKLRAVGRCHFRCAISSSFQIQQCFSSHPYRTISTQQDVCTHTDLHIRSVFESRDSNLCVWCTCTSLNSVLM